MTRALIAYTVCLILALISVSGAHVHAHGVAHHDHEAAAHGAIPETAHAAVHATADIDMDHLSDHEHHGAVDIDRDAKVSGKHSIDTPVSILALWCWVFSVDVEPRGAVITFAPPLRPPQPRSRFFVFPPSHAPPSLLA